MGKVRVKTIGIEEEEKAEKEKQKQRKEAKKTVKAPGMKGGERVVSVGPSEEELASLEAEVVEKKEETTEKPLKKQKFQITKKQSRSNRYNDLKVLIDKSKEYSLSEGLSLLEKMQNTKFDQTVELHLNLIEKGVSGQVTLPHGTGKTTKVAIANDQLIAEIEKGRIDFDVLVADPSMMPKLAKVARILGPKGLMPNPKNGTISNKPEEVAKKYEGGQISFRTESKAPIIHLAVGKVSFGEAKLAENIKTVISAVKKEKIQKAVLKSTMSPGIKLAV